MNFASVRLITDHVGRLADFYEHVTGRAAVRHTPDFAELVLPGATLAIGSTATVALFGAGEAEPAANRTAIIEFRVDDVDAEFTRLRDVLGAVIQEPTTMPWGNRSLLFRDPDGTLVNLFTPVTAEATARQSR
ncbi:VOC family protein [Paractinoplanes globisporus]|uniref:VOC family protein n=1 Tax=Paractinoplanes globisporus TaxID=113565 RepID=A0ABW6W6S7_9ACTN|nr:VOC family protein [Actinoplanes globisporus]